MRHTYTLLLYIAALTALMACSDGNDFGDGYHPSLQPSSSAEVAQVMLNLSVTSVSFLAEAQSTTITVTTNYAAWSATSNAAWCTVATSESTLTVTALANTSVDERTAMVTVTAGSETRYVWVTQAGNAGGTKPLVFTITGNGKTATFKMILVEAGSFQMGSDDSDAYSEEQPVHQVTLTKDYYMGETEVTQALWQAVMGTNLSHFKGDNLPVEEVSWDDCQTFIDRLNDHSVVQAQGVVFRLPTEAEWEFAARGGRLSRGYKYAGSDNLDDVGWYTDNSGSATHKVGKKAPNELGLYDMSGNVYEWCQDWYGSYSSGSQMDPTGASSGSTRVLRGGSWFDDAWRCRSSYRDGSTPSYSGYDLGLRLAL